MSNQSHTRNDSGFTLVEILVVVGIMGVVLVQVAGRLNFTRRDVDYTSRFIVSKIEEAKTKSLSGASYQGNPRCGYGIHRSALNTAFEIYAGPISGVVSCTGQNRNFAAPEDIIVETIALPERSVVFIEATPGIFFYDIFFEPPKPSVFVNNAGLSTTPAGRIIIGPTGGDCVSNAAECRIICVYTSGKIETVGGTASCPAN